MSSFTLVIGFILGFLFRQRFTIVRRTDGQPDIIDDQMTHIKEILKPSRRRVISPSRTKNLLKDLEDETA